MEVAQYLIVAIGSALFGGMVGYKWGRADGRNLRIRDDAARRVDDDHRRLTAPRCNAWWHDPSRTMAHGSLPHVCYLDEGHELPLTGALHRCDCGAPYPTTS